MDGKLILDTPRTGAENMAIDDAMLQWCDEQQQIALRIYRWSKPTLSLGYFQPWEEWVSYSAQLFSGPPLAADSCLLGTSNLASSIDMDVVRRRTGGGAIVHHHDWTYSLAVPWDQVQLGPTRHLYQWVHSGLVNWLDECGFKAHLQTTSDPASKSAAFLCFQRRTEGDILVGHHKVIGSAQRRGKRSLLQHGSVLLRRSPMALSLLGLRELVEIPVPSSPLDEPTTFERSIQEVVGTRFDVAWTRSNNVSGFGGERISENLALHSSTSWLERV